MTAQRRQLIRLAPLLAITALAATGCARTVTASAPANTGKLNTMNLNDTNPDAPAGATDASADKVARSDSEWRQTLSAEQYRILRQKGTERAFTGKYWNNHDDGTYTCAGCGQTCSQATPSSTAAAAGPVFTRQWTRTAVEFHDDYSFGMRRVEVTCRRCGGHLGHVFDDGPKDKTGLRYCINSASIEFKKSGGEPDKDASAATTEATGSR
jgi:peptide-methionine (R)-S-oxide reductase